MIHEYWLLFVELIHTPFEHVTLIWTIVPLYFGLLLNELTSSKANFRTAIQTGFSFLWAGAQWLYPYFRHDAHGTQLRVSAMLPINFLVTFLVLGLGVMALICGLMKKFPKYGRALGHTRFVNYFMITIFPMQAPYLEAHYLAWTWARLVAIIIFAVPVWLVLHFGLMPIRGK